MTKMTIDYPRKGTITAGDRILVVSLGGSAASSSVDRISTLATDLAEAWNGAHPQRRIVAVTGYATPFTASSRVADKVVETCEWMLEKSGVAPALVLVGKSMGGCKLHKVAEHLSGDAIGVDLFVGVEVSCHVARHYDNWVEHGWDEKVFPATVVRLVNLYQTKAREAQCGHVAVWQGHGACAKAAGNVCLDYNADVRKDMAFVDAAGCLVHGGAVPIAAADVGHKEIDSDPGVLSAVKAVVTGRVGSL